MQRDDSNNGGLVFHELGELAHLEQAPTNQAPLTKEELAKIKSKREEELREQAWALGIHHGPNLYLSRGRTNRAEMPQVKLPPLPETSPN